MSAARAQEGKEVDKADTAVDDKSGKYAESISTSMVLVAQVTDH